MILIAFLLLDEATASLDEAAEAALYQLLNERLPDTAIISIGHRSTLRAFHLRHSSLERDEHGSRPAVMRCHGACDRGLRDAAAARQALHLLSL
jgi:ABC-type uncharacterized transport system fused permease/ATPase subunit